jgi:chromosome segregation ATPase
MKSEQERIERLENEIDKLKETLLQLAWELEFKEKHRFITVKEEEHLKKRIKPASSSKPKES